MTKVLKISILVDTPDSWILPFAKDICARFSEQHDIQLYFEASEVREGDMLFLLGCTSIIPDSILARNRNNLVVHESNLPEGRGWAPVAWQVLKGKNRIPIVLFQATNTLDAGPIYLRDCIELDGTELLPEIKQKQGEKTVQLVDTFLKKWPDVKCESQVGEPTYFPKRTEGDDELDPQKTIIENFNHLRIVHNEKYPAWFRFKGEKYILKIYQAE
jgi:methionyl-tRNA formyltransferase